MKYFFSIILLILFNINSSFSQNSLGSIIENTNLALPSSYNFVEYVFPEPNDEGSCSGLTNTTASIDKIFFSQTHRMSIDQPFYFLIGHSDGGTIAALGSRGKTINNLIGTVLLAPHFFIEGDNLKAIEKTRYQYEHGSLRSKLEKYHIDVDNAFYGWSNVWLDKNFKDWDITNHISEIRTPVLGIQGLNDPYGSIEQLNVIQKNIKVTFTKKTIKDCGHNPLNEYPDITLKFIHDFIINLL